MLYCQQQNEFPLFAIGQIPLIDIVPQS